MVIFTILFFPHVFVVVRDINFIIAYEVDPGSMIQALISLYQNNYNMNAAYHSSFYGWTYFSLSYLLLLPIYLVKALGIVKDDYIFFVGIRFVFFLIGLAGVLGFFQVAKRILKSALLAFLAALVFIASPAVFSYFYFIHPESTGLLFLFLGVLCLLNFNDSGGEDTRWYTFGLISLVLSALSKQVFFITALPVLFLYYYLYCCHHSISFWKFAFSRRFVKILLFTILLSVIVFFIVHPFAFLQFKTFVENQKVLFSTQTHGAVSRVEAIGNWIRMIQTLPIIYISIIAAPFTLLGVMIFVRDQKINRTFFLVNLLSSVLYVVLISISARYLIQAGYFAPIYPFFILGFLVIPLFIVRKWDVNWLKLVIIASLAYFLFFVLVSDFSVSIPMGYTRLMYKETAIYKIYSYIQNRIPDGSRIAHDHLVAFPSDEGLLGCQYWQGCGTDYIEEFQPDYVIFSEDWTFNGEILPETRRLKKYVKDHKFLLVDTITYGDNDQISVWKKSDPD